MIYEAHFSGWDRYNLRDLLWVGYVRTYVLCVQILHNLSKHGWPGTTKNYPLIDHDLSQVYVNTRYVKKNG